MNINWWDIYIILVVQAILRILISSNGMFIFASFLLGVTMGIYRGIRNLKDRGSDEK